MDFSTTIDDSNVDTLARKLGWTDTVIDGLGGPQGTPNPVDQSTWIANKATEYLNNELQAALAITAAEAARQQAISDAQQQLSLNTSTVTTVSSIKPLPPVSPPVRLPPQ